MRMHVRHGWVLLGALALVGCGYFRSTSTEPEAVAEEAVPDHLSDQTDLNVEDWLSKPREELARLSDEWADNVANLHRHTRDNPLAAELLPELHPPVTAPVFQSARFSAKAGFSLPPYLAEGKKDPAVALHLARYGDVEAALKLADPADKALVSQIEACRGKRNYPVEWTRLVGLALQMAEVKLSAGKLEGATELIQLHKQVRTLLDEKTAKGPLGSTLLSSGHRALTQAVAAWRDPKLNKPTLAEDAEAALNAWGPVATTPLAVAPKAGRTELANLFGAEAKGKTVATTAPAALNRLLDLLGLPLPPEGVQAVVGFLDADGALAEWLVCYRGRINVEYPTPAHLAHYLVNHEAKSQEPAQANGLRHQVYSQDGLAYDVIMAPENNSAGALVRVLPEKGPGAPAALPADAGTFGAFHLDGTFEGNKVRLAPDQSGDTLRIDKPETLALLKPPVANPAPGAALVRRGSNPNLVASFAFLWPPDRTHDALTRIGVPLWSAYGGARLEAQEGGEGGAFALVWEDARTRVTFRLPYKEEQPPQLEVVERADKADARASLDAANALEKAQRKARLAASQPCKRLPRSLPLSQVPGDQFQLGMPWNQLLTELPRTQFVRTHTLADGLSLLFLNEPHAGATYWSRQVFFRPGPDKKLAEIRVRYQEGPHAPTKTAPALLALLKKTAGEPEKAHADWADLWADLPGPGGPAPVCWRWVDDESVLTYQRDKGGIEVTLRDCPPSEGWDSAPPPLQFCSRGVEGLSLGDARAAVLKRWKVDQPTTTADGALVIGQPAAGPYDLALVWFEDGKAARIIARHRAASPLKAAEVPAALQAAWGRDIDHLGTVRRQDAPAGQTLQGYFFHDDKTRVRIFGQEMEDGPRLFTEWRDWPAAQKTAMAKPK